MVQKKQPRPLVAACHTLAHFVARALSKKKHPLHAAMVGGGAWFLSGDARVGAVVGAGTLAYMLAFGHSLPAFLGFGGGGGAAASSSKDQPPTVIIPHDWRTVR